MGFEFGKIAETIKEALANPELDKIEKETKAALKEAKEAPENSNLAVSLLEAGLSGLREDLEELKIDPSLWPEYEKAFQSRFELATKGLQNEAIMASMEAKKLDLFVNDFAQFSKLDNVIAECKKKESGRPLIQLIRFIQSNSSFFEGFGLGGSSFMAMLGIEKEENKKPSDKPAPPSKLDQKAAEADKTIQDQEAKKAAKSTTEEPKEPEKASEADTSEESVEKTPAYTENVESNDKYKVNPENAEKLNPTEFRKRFAKAKDRHARHMLVLQQVAAGNATPNFETITITGKTGKTLELEVDKGGLRVCGMEVQLDAPTAMAAAELSSCTLPTPWISDRITEQARKTGGLVEFIAAPQIAAALDLPWNNDNPDGKWMMSAEFAVKRDEMLREWRKEHNISDDQLVAGYFKDIVHPTPGKSRPGYINIYGGIRQDDSRIQGTGNFHKTSYSDYPQQVRRISNTVTVGNEEMSIFDFYKNPAFAEEFGFEAQALDGYPYPSALQTYVNQNKKS